VSSNDGGGKIGPHCVQKFRWDGDETGGPVPGLILR
jgi:hypothetical protein